VADPLELVVDREPLGPVIGTGQRLEAGEQCLRAQRGLVDRP
jgi:hypothetical protein